MLNNLDRLLCKIAEFYPHWARALLVLNPRAGDSTRLSATGLVINARGIDDEMMFETFVPVVHAVLDHAGDRAALKAQGFSAAALSGFDCIAEYLARRAAARGVRQRNRSGYSLAIASQRIADAVGDARTLRDLAGLARTISEEFGAEELAALGSGFAGPDLSEGYRPEEDDHDPEIVRSFSREVDIPMERAAPAALAEAADAYVAFLAAETPDACANGIDLLITAACSHLEDATRAPNGPAWATLLMEIALGRVLELGMQREVCAMPSFNRYRDLRKSAGLS